MKSPDILIRKTMIFVPAISVATLIATTVFSNPPDAQVSGTTTLAPSSVIGENQDADRANRENEQKKRITEEESKRIANKPPHPETKEELKKEAHHRYKEWIFKWDLNHDGKLDAREIKLMKEVLAKHPRNSDNPNSPAQSSTPSVNTESK